MSDYRGGFGFVDHLRVVTTDNYNIIADFHTLQITTAHAKSYTAFSVFTRRFLVTASNNGFFLCFRVEVHSERRLPSNCLFLLQLSSL
jgi:hypothetical protein